MSGILPEYTPRRPRSSDQAPRGDFFRQPQRTCSGRGEFTSITLATHTCNARGSSPRERCRPRWSVRTRGLKSGGEICSPRITSSSTRNGPAGRSGLADDVWRVDRTGLRRRSGPSACRATPEVLACNEATTIVASSRKVSLSAQKLWPSIFLCSCPSSGQLLFACYKPETRTLIWAYLPSYLSRNSPASTCVASNSVILLPKHGSWLNVARICDYSSCLT